MQEFILSALPLVMMGIALALLAVNNGKEKQEDDKKRTKFAIGAGFGF